MTKSKKLTRKEKIERNRQKGAAGRPTGAAKPMVRETLLLGLFIAFVAFAIYANTFGNDFILDDSNAITENHFVKQGVAGIPDILTTEYRAGYWQARGNLYRPVSLVMFAVEWQLFPNNPFPGHLINVLVYALCALLLFRLLCRLLPGWSVLVPALITLLFVVHPIHTEVVANIKGRDEIVTMLGSIAALYFSLRAYREQKPLLSALAGLIFFLGLMAKENAITFLAVVPLAYYFFTKAKTSSIVIQTLPFIIAAAIFLAIRTSILGWDFGGDPPRELMNNPFLKFVDGQWVDFSAGERFATIFYTLGKYLQLMVFPHPLCHDYYPRAVDIMSFGDWQVILSLFIYVGMGVYALLGMKKKDPVSFGILYYLATLSIVSNIFFPIGTNMGERFIYMPSLGFALVVAVLLWRWGKDRWYSRGFVLAGALVLLLLAGKSVVRNTVWKDNFTLFTHDVKIQPRSAKLQTAAGGDLVTHAIKPENTARKQQMLEEGVAHLLEAVKIHPTYKNAYLLLGNAFNYLQRYEESIQYYQQALAIDPNYAEARNNLAITYANAGRYYGEQKGDLNKAIEYLLKANEMKPNTYETLRLLGVAYGIGGRVNEALEYFKQAAALQPNDPDALYNLGTAYFNAGQPEEAEKYFQQARAIKPDIDQERKQQRN